MLILAVVGWIGSIAVLSIKQTNTGRAADPLDSVRNEDRSRLAPVRKLQAEIEKVVADNSSNVAVKVIGAEALTESNRIVDQCVRMLNLRAELSRATAGKSEAERGIAALEAQKAAATSDQERATLDSALAARRLEADHYAGASGTLERIDAGLAQAQAALSEMKSRLAMAAAGGSSAEDHEGELADTISRLKTLGASLDEAEQMAQGQTT
jgi:hypothetical protein